jgi:hypothetical protein
MKSRGSIEPRRTRSARRSSPNSRLPFVLFVPFVVQPLILFLSAITGLLIEKIK